MKIKPLTIMIGMGKPTFPIPKHYLALGQELARRGHQVHLLMHHHHPVEEKSGNPNIHYWPFWLGGKRYFLDFIFLLRLARTYKPDCVIAAHRETRMLMLVGFLLRIPVRVLYHHTLTTQVDLDTRQQLFFVRLQRLLRIPLYSWFPTHSVGVSLEAANDLKRRYSVPAAKCHVLYNSLEDPLSQRTFSNILSGETPERIVCVGRLDVSKGQDILIRAIEKLRHTYPNIKVYFVGDGNFRVELAQLISTLGLERNCCLVGNIPHDAVLKYMANASVTVCPSRMDNLPTVVIESFAVQTPVVATNVGGIPEIFGSMTQECLVAPNSADALANRLSELLANPLRLDELRSQVRERFLSAFETRTVIPQQASWFESLFPRQHATQK